MSIFIVQGDQNMKNTLQSIYPNLIITHDKEKIENNFYFIYNSFYYIFKDTQLSDSEKLLLSNMTNSEEQLTPWQKLLINGDCSSIVWVTDLQFVYFSTNFGINDKQLFLYTFSTFFESCVDYFFINNYVGCFVIQSAPNKDILEQQIAVLEEDFETTLRLLIGIKIEEHDDILSIVSEELHNFSISKSNHGIFEYKDHYLHSSIKPIIQSSAIAQTILRRVDRVEESKQTIQALWKYQGNLTSTSQSLFIHRNTLNYRIDKFYETTSLNLRNLDDLLLCYLLTL